MPNDPTETGDAPTPDTRQAAPGLHLIATPIGAARDITLRALDLLMSCDVLVAEDTRSLRKLMEIHGVHLAGRPLLSYHDHNGSQVRPRILRFLSEGKSVLYASEAGTPLVADPGYQLTRGVIDEGYALHAAPGPSALLAALAVAGLPTDRFAFLGFPPSQSGPRRKFLQEAAALKATLVFYESPKRIHRLLTELCDTFGADRQAALCRELTKKHEEVIRMSLSDLQNELSHRSLRGEIVLVVDRGAATEVSDQALDDALTEALDRLSLKEAVASVATQLDLPRRRVYQAALEKENRS
ncbi:MAG: 16S rRNA (cytidine(1402)-2'-O)-methyltransferase [Roseinatronobacter sp.]